ncbi:MULTISPECIES: ATP-binding protein [unclassified Oceanispirochaeta]|uniref:sensor histidine kinase n=1 Tax=unclassified Oceanispirochaeta TaxID=2635722 RepID=UPI000E09A66B|nr:MULTISPECIES: ATP-binding protein [unclassified Oceanispirochaeta]MBF9015984.1 PAS domain S-box protein [Oceanispirochaeta sp. M2]NPD72447.1 PAS domain S-box protein [Oceanispirochaeta sp. M1]RDG31907.1 PAS domain S-box protein [Oceanispirochaeta sp. M1]
MKYLLNRPGMFTIYSSGFFVLFLILAAVIFIPSQPQSIHNNLSSKLDDAVFSTMQSGIESLTTSKAVIDLATGGTAVDNPIGLNTLDTANRIFNSSLVYIVDLRGNVIACTPFNDDQTLTGNNYFFRPYVQSAISGKNTVYPALGITTLERGLYFSSPVYSEDNQNIIGAVVIKIGLEQIDNVLNEYEEPVVLITPKGVVFASNFEEFIYHFAYPLSDEQLVSIHESKQFADKIIKPMPFFLDKNKIDYKGNEYKIQKETFFDSGWEIVVFQSLRVKYLFNRNTVLSVCAFIFFLLCAIFFLIRNIMIIKEGEIALRKSKETYQTLFSLAPDGICISGINGEILSFNDSFSGIFKYPPEKLKTMRIDQLYANPDKDRVPLLEELIKKRKVRNYPLDMKDSLDKVIKTLNSFALIDYNDMECIETIIMDITEIEEKEQLLRQAQKMQLMGTLAAGLAHDFNNMVGGISGNIALVKFILEKNNNISNEELKKFISRIEISIKRSEDLIHQLLSLSRKNEFKSVPVDLNESIKNVTSICRTTFDRSIEIVTNYCETPALTKGDPTQIEQVILNLCINASHAMTIMRTDGNSGGQLSVSVKKRSDDSLFPGSQQSYVNKNYWVISIKDSGIGINPEYMDDLFKPFFTTKENNEGTGLGLAMVKNIIEQHQGLMEINTEVGVGTTFYISLPILVD